MKYYAREGDRESALIAGLLNFGRLQLVAAKISEVPTRIWKWNSTLRILPLFKDPLEILTTSGLLSNILF